jgi:hypothetical protein
MPLFAGKERGCIGGFGPWARAWIGKRTSYKMQSLIHSEKNRVVSRVGTNVVTQRRNYRYYCSVGTNVRFVTESVFCLSIIYQTYLSNSSKAILPLIAALVKESWT